MKHLLFVVTFLLLTDTCGPTTLRQIKNNTSYGVEIINYENQTNDGSDTLNYLKPHEEFSLTVPFDAWGFFQTPPFKPEQTDSLVIYFYQEGTDTIYRKRFLQYDTTLLFRCLTGSEPETCFIEERHLEGATLIVK